jgi:hypothetical protein
MEGKFNFIAPKRGPYKFCFHNRAAELETIDFNVNFGHVIHEEEHVKDGELKCNTGLLNKVAFTLGMFHRIYR